MLRRADVVLGDVQENGGIKMRVSDSLVFERLGGLLPITISGKGLHLRHCAYDGTAPGIPAW